MLTFSRRDVLRSTFSAAAGVVPLIALATQATAVHAEDIAKLPQVTVTNLRRAFHNGEHNAFTDLCRFRGKLYLTFRSCPDGHMLHPTSTIIVMRSDDDGQKWEQVHRFRVDLRDVRDPHFLVFRDKLWVYTGTWYTGKTTPDQKTRDLNMHLGYAAWSDDGAKWEGPKMLEGTFGHYIWRAASHGEKAYLCGRRKIDFQVGPRETENVQSLMLESDDGLIWRKRVTFRETVGNETAFLFEPDGTVLAIARDSDAKEAQVMRSKPPYESWHRKNLGFPIGGPLLARWGERYLVGGRKTTKEHGPRTSLNWLDNDRLVEFADLPSAGDNSYPGFVELSKTRGLISYYSSHEKDDKGKAITAIYLAELNLKE